MLLYGSMPENDFLLRQKEQFPQLQLDTMGAVFRLLRTANLINKKYEEHFSQYDLTHAKFVVLSILQRSPDNTKNPAGIAREMAISLKNVLRLLEGMEQRKLIRREQDTSDKRASIITITGEGKELFDLASPGVIEICNDAMKSLSQNDKEILSHMLQKIYADLRCKDVKDAPWW